MNTCPLCKTEVETIERLVFDADGTLWIDGNPISLSYREGIIIEAMISAHPRVSKLDFLLSQLYPIDDEPISGKGCLTIAILHIRRKIKGTALKIVNVWSQGWRLELEGKEQ